MNKKNRGKPSPLNQQSILDGQSNLCFYCGVPLWAVEVNWDHFEPYAFARNRSIGNFVASCGMCNRIKSDLMFPDRQAAIDYIRSIRTARRLPNYERGRIIDPELPLCWHCREPFKPSNSRHKYCTRECWLKTQPKQIVSEEAKKRSMAARRQKRERIKEANRDRWAKAVAAYRQKHETETKTPPRPL